jgi:hypothetical protein
MIVGAQLVPDDLLIRACTPGTPYSKGAYQCFWNS